MSTSRQAVLPRGLVPLALIPAVFLCAILATVILEVFVDRHGLNSSLTTLFPGVAYATALVMKVCIAEGLVSTVVALASRTRRLQLGWGILSAALTPLAPLTGALAVVIAEALVDKPEGVSFSYFPGTARTGVLAMLVCIMAGVVAAIIALSRREPPRSRPFLALVTNAFLVGMFRYFEFYKLGFDQDGWAES